MRENESVNQVVSSLRIIYFALLSGILLFAATVFYLIEQSEVISLGTGDPLILPSISLAIGLPFLSHWLFQRAMRSSEKGTQQHQKLSYYQNQYIIRLAIAEMPALFSLVCYLLNNNVICLFTFGWSFFYFASLYPSTQRYSDDIDQIGSS